MLESTDVGVSAPVAGPVPAVVDPSDLAFGSLLAALTMSDKKLTADDFDPAAVVGALRGKVDSVKWVDERFKIFEKFMRSLAAPLTKAAKSAKRNRLRLRAYLTRHMHENAFQEVPGDMYRIVLHEPILAPQLEITRAATAQDFLEFPGHVRCERVYSWDAKAVFTDLESGALAECDFAKIVTPVSRFVKFYPQRALPPAKKRRSSKNVKEITSEPASP